MAQSSVDSASPSSESETVRFNAVLLRRTLAHLGFQNIEAFYAERDHDGREYIKRTTFQAILRSAKPTNRRMPVKYVQIVSDILGIKNPDVLVDPGSRFSEDIVDRERAKVGKLALKGGGLRSPVPSEIDSTREQTVKEWLPRPPIVNELKKGGKHILPGDWALCYFTRVGKNTHEARTLKVAIRDDGYYVAKLPGVNLQYEGVLILEEAGRFALLARSTPDSCMREMSVFRFEYDFSDTQRAGHRILIPGAWFGLDMLYQPRASYAVLCSYDGKDEEIHTAFDASVLAKMGSMDEVWENEYPSVGKSKGTIVVDKWNSEFVRSLIESCQHGETVEFCATYFSEDYIVESIRTLYKKKLPAPPEVHHKKYDKRLRLRFFLTHYKDYIIERRTAAYAADYADDIIELAINLTRLGEEVAEKINIEVNFFSCWPFGHCIKIGSRAIVNGTLWTHCNATRGPMVVCFDPQSTYWADTVESLEAIKATRLEPVEINELEKLKGKRKSTKTR